MPRVNLPAPQVQGEPFLGRELEWRLRPNARAGRHQLRRQAPMADTAHLVTVPAIVADPLRAGSGKCWVMAARKSVAVKTSKLRLILASWRRGICREKAQKTQRGRAATIRKKTESWRDRIMGRRNGLKWEHRLVLRLRILLCHDGEVETPVARRPPHRSRRAVFQHRALQNNSPHALALR